MFSLFFLESITIINTFFLKVAAVNSFLFCTPYLLPPAISNCEGLNIMLLVLDNHRCKIFTKPQSTSESLGHQKSIPEEER